MNIEDELMEDEKEDFATTNASMMHPNVDEVNLDERTVDEMEELKRI